MTTTTYLAMQGFVSAELSDPSNLTFDTAAIKAFIQQGLVEIGRIAPDQFQEDLSPVAARVSYPLRLDEFSFSPPEVRVVRVEVWGGTPSRFKFKIKSKAGQPTRDSTAGWEVWNGSLEIPDWVADVILTTDIIRVWGYSPYPSVINDSDFIPVSADLELALRTFCRVEGLRRLTSSRVLFKQWQARSNNTDVTLGGLNSDLQVAEEQWRRLARALKVPEQNPD
jgi:hypothetical protein